MFTHILKTLLPLVIMSTLPARASDQPRLLDNLATPQTVALYENLYLVGQNHVLFGHHETLAYGHDWIGEPNRSDVKDVTGDFPAIYGWDMGIVEPRSSDKEDAPRFDANDLLEFVRQAHARGGIVEFSWHGRNPVTRGAFNDLTPAVHTILPGGENHEAYKGTLDAFADFFLKISPMPVIFRPFHEHNGEWFWWGKTHVSEQDYIALWRFTVEYLRDKKGVHNLIYAFSPDRGRIDLSHGWADYFYGYPGDEYVDVMGLDDYIDVRLPRADQHEPPLEIKKQDFVRSLTMVAEIAEAHHKVPALTETGCDTLNIPNWWTQILLPSLEANEQTRKIAWLQVWRNANAELEKHEHFFAPYKGHPAEEDFRQFHDSPFVLFEAELPPMYSRE
jgi:mannan endo-1,4-beta-mannosidase